MSVPAEKVTTMGALKPIENAEAHMPVVTMGFGSLQSFELMQRAGKALAAASLVPKEFVGNLPNCIIALEMASRIGASPLMVMQNLYVVYGRPSWSAKFLIACFNQCGRFSAIRYQWSGTEGKDTWGCQAWATEKSTGEKITGPLITIDLAKKEGWYSKNGSKWQTIPGLMLMYRAAAWLVNTHAPEISMGLNTDEEMHDVFDARRGADGSYSVTTESLRQASETVDKQTGEITDYVPQFDDAGAIAELKKAKTPDALAKSWQGVIDDFANSNRELPKEVHGAYTDRLAALEQKS